MIQEVKTIKNNVIDKLDTKILAELIQNSRIPLTTLAKKLKASREVITYRINKLKKDKVILDFVTEIDIKKLGFIGAAVFLNIKANKEEEFKKYLNDFGFVSWVAEHSGMWGFGLSIIGKTNQELDEKFIILYNKFKDDIINYRFTLHKKNTFMYEKYCSTTTSIDKSKIISYSVDKKDKVILKELAKNSRIDCVELANKVKLTAPAVAKRIKQLENSKIIQKYSIFVDVSKIGLFQYSIFSINKNIDNKEKFISYLTQHTKINFIAEYVGDPFVEFGIFIENPYELRNVLLEVEEAFPDNKIMEISLFHKEFISIGPPKCVFE